MKKTLSLLATFALVVATTSLATSIDIQGVKDVYGFGNHVVFTTKADNSLVVFDRATREQREFTPPGEMRYSFISGEMDGKLYLYTPHKPAHIRSFDPSTGEFGDPVPNSKYCESLVRIKGRVFCGGAYAANFPSPDGSMEPIYVYESSGISCDGGFRRWEPVYRISEADFQAGLMQPRFFLGEWHGRLLIGDSIRPIVKVYNPNTGLVEREIGDPLPDELPEWNTSLSEDQYRELVRDKPLFRILGYSRVRFTASDGRFLAMQIRGVDGGLRTRVYRLSNGELNPRHLPARLKRLRALDGTTAVGSLDGGTQVYLSLEKRKVFNPRLGRDVTRWDSQGVVLAEVGRLATRRSRQ